MIDELRNHSSTAQALIDEGRKEEALRMTRIVLARRFGALSPAMSVALENMDTAALEAIACDPTLTVEHLHARLEQHPDGAPPTRSREGIRDQQGNPVRLSPLGGYRTS